MLGRFFFEKCLVCGDAIIRNDNFLIQGVGVLTSDLRWHQLEANFSAKQIEEPKVRMWELTIKSNQISMELSSWSDRSSLPQWEVLLELWWGEEEKKKQPHHEPFGKPFALAWCTSVKLSFKVLSLIGKFFLNGLEEKMSWVKVELPQVFWACRTNKIKHLIDREVSMD